MYKKGAKFIASMLVFVMMFTYISIAHEVIAAGVSALTNNENVEFEAYFKENESKTYAAIKTIGEENYLYAKVTVKDAGYLKSASIKFENANFEIPDTYSDTQVAKVENGVVTLNQIKNGNTVELAIPINFKSSETVNPSEFNTENKISFDAIYVDGKGKEVEIEKDTTVTLAWTNEKEAQLDMQITKFIPYEINNTKALMLQMNLISYLKDNKLPVAQEKIEISVPVIDNVKPETVKVVANTTKATNGDAQGLNFSEENYTYNQEEGKLTIVVENKENAEGKISWIKDAQDEFIITYIYPENTQVSSEGTKIGYGASSELTLIEASQTHARKTITREDILKEQIGSLVDFNVKTNIETTSKGQMYANYDATNKYETEYEETLIVDASMASLVDTVVIDVNEDSFVKQDQAKQVASTYVKQIEIEKANFDKILSEEGTIKIYNGETLISTIDKNITANEEGKLIVDLTEFNVNKIKLETSDIVEEGKITLKVTKAIKKETNYTIAQMQEFTKVELNSKLTANNESLTIVEKEVKNEIALTEPTTNAQISIEPSNLSTVVMNNDVKLKVALKTDTLDCKLYKNPTLNITLPSYIEEINIKNVEVLFETAGTKLTLKNYNLIPNADGTKTIQIVLEGTQTEYSLGSVSKGLNVVVTSDIKVNKLTPNKEEKVTLVYTNNNINVEEKQTQCAISFVAPTGIVTVSSVSNYADNASVVTSVNSEEKVATIPTMQNARNVKFEMNLINNYTNTIDNIAILGRLPFKSNTDASTGVALGSTFDMNLASNLTVSGIDTNKVKVYYSENANATKDLNNAANGWTNTPADLSKVKAYLIILEDYTMKTGEGISFAYDALLPEGLQHNEYAYQNYVAYFNNNMESGTIEDKMTAGKLGITTGRGPVIEASLESNISENEEVQTGNFIKYTLAVKNTGTEDAQNVTAGLTIPEGLQCVVEDSEKVTGYNIIASEGETIQVEFGNIAPGKTIEKELLMKVSILSEDSIKAQLKAKVNASNISGELETKEVSNTLVKTYFNVGSTVTSKPEGFKQSDVYTYTITVLSSDLYSNRENTVLEIKIPEEIEYQEVTILNKEGNNKTDITNEVTSKYDKKTRMLTVDLGTVDGMVSKLVEVKVKVLELPQDVYSKEITPYATVSAKDVRMQEIPMKTIEVGKVGIKASQTCTITENSEITAYEDFKYVFTVENLSSIYLEDVELKDVLPKGVTFDKAVVTYESGVTKNIYKADDDGNATIKFNLKAKEIAKVEIYVLADLVDEDTQVSNSATIKYKDIAEVTTNTITHTIKKYNETVRPEDNQTKRIVGQVWIDSNNNGQKDEGEEKVSNVEVRLFNNQTGDFVKDSEGNVIKVYTSQDGTYTFQNVVKGNYTVAFLYDSANYSSTEYRKENVDETKNSDALDTKVVIDEVTRVAAITEEIIVSDENVYNIDLGIVSNKKFDLKLEKTVSKITIQDSEGTKVYEYKDSKLAKRDLVADKVNDTTIVVEYKIKVTNEGAVPGYVKKIVDYMPEEMKFSSELNRDWYTASNGAIYNSSLANTVINPGETKEVTLLLSKKMSEDTLGLINNTAEIYEAYNDLGLEDVDSSVANKVSEEDDMSGADILITVKTGQWLMFIGLTLTIITIIGASAYIIKKKVLI